MIKFSEVILTPTSTNRNLQSENKNDISNRHLTADISPSPVLIDVNNAVEFSNSSLIVGTNSKRKVVSGLTISSTIPFVLSDSLELNS